jgi:uncharacterized protein YuzE
VEIRYYPETDSAYISFSKNPGVWTHVIVDGVNADIDAEDRLVGIEFERASKHLMPELLKAHESKESITA